MSANTKMQMFAKKKKDRTAWWMLCIFLQQTLASYCDLKHIADYTKLEGKHTYHRRLLRNWIYSKSGITWFNCCMQLPTGTKPLQGQNSAQTTKEGNKRIFSQHSSLHCYTCVPVIPALPYFILVMKHQICTSCSMKNCRHTRCNVLRHYNRTTWKLLPSQMFKFTTCSSRPAKYHSKYCTEMSTLTRYVCLSNMFID